MIWYFLPLGLLAYAMVEYTWFKTVKVDIDQISSKAAVVNNKRLVFLSDLQYDHKIVGFRHYAARKMIKKVKALKPDLIIIGGDVIHKKNDFAHLIFPYLDSIECEKIAILGNHDFYDLDLVLSAYKRMGVRVLRNECMMFDDIQIVGIEHSKVEGALIPNFERTPFTLVVSHGPDVLVANAVQADFMLAGHLHGGQVTVLGLYAPITNSVYKEKYLHGLKTVKASKLYVSSGLGGYVGILPIRFFSRPEIVVLDF